jgi:hypothetical protein
MKKRKYTDALDWAATRFSKEELDNNYTLNPAFVLMPKSPDMPAFRAVQKIIITILQEARLPHGFGPAIPTGPNRAPQFQRNLETLLCNFIVMDAKGKRTLAVSRSPNSYANTDLTRGIINLYDAMRHANLISSKLGFNLPNQARLTRLKPRQQLRKLYLSIGEDDVYAEPTELINLRQRRGAKQRQGDLIPRHKWPELTRKQMHILDTLRATLQWFNLVLREYQIDYLDGRTRKLLFPVLYTSYSGDFEHGGRFYTGRGGHTNLSKTERATIRFNRRPTKELDFSGLHLRMLYDLRGVSFPSNRDPYAEVLLALRKNPNVIFDQFPDIRDDLKEMLLALINDKASAEQAEQRATWRLFNDWKVERDEKLKAVTKEVSQRREKQWQQAGLTVPGVLKAFHKAHRPIAADFASGVGVRLQNLDAQIARWVMMEMMVSNADLCVPTLPVHDSFITFREYAKQLHQAMQSSYAGVLQQATRRKTHFEIPIS